MKETFDIVGYMSRGVTNIVKNAAKASLSNPAESMFMARFALASAAASQKRAKAEKEGEHIPAFLIASITSRCNLHCAGCYSRANQACTDTAPVCQLTTKEWQRIFSEANELGISFILLAGGEPMMRRDVIEAAGRISNIVFPVFTNGTLLDDSYMELLKRSRNLLPVVSIEGREENTDQRRGEGVYEQAIRSMALMRENGIFYGASVTATTENLGDIYSDEFIDNLCVLGCRVLFFIEYVPVTEESSHLAPGDEERAFMEKQLCRVREKYPDMVFVSFPGDEKASGGCVAAGRGFFHINSHGGAEPCPFSPYSDVNVKDTSLKDALHSRLFTKLRENGTLLEDHAGGCVLFEKRSEVKSYL